MITNKIHDKELSLLGFGAMRLPLNEDGSIDEKQVFEMVKYAGEHGVNYYDMAYPYHQGNSELVMGRALKQFPRESYCLATKYPGHQIASSYNPAEIFEIQLKKCDVEYFDYYLLHNVYENSIQVYTDSKWGIIDYFIKQKEMGRIKHLGFSCHGCTELLKEFLDGYGDKMEFCQIQLNYLDWTLQDAKAKYELLTERNIPVWVMEPVRGGKLAAVDKENEEKLKELRPEESVASWAFRWLQGLPNVKMVLSGMSSMEQMIDNVHTFEQENPLSENEEETLMQLAETMKDSLPCTGCRYCCDGCPKGIDIPKMIGYYNEMKVAPSFNIGMSLDAVDREHLPSACIKCGKCKNSCPQNIDITSALEELTDMVGKLPSWADICRQREEEAKAILR
ncbi:MAG: aldo/keto reductase [Lachnospiraceae bacterium]|nr:aldo/keto reductase [Lachnospiraceae bacterium]